VDGQVGRVLKKSDTYNSTTKKYDYPQTPSRVQLSLWPGGLSSNAPGTISWAGGPIDWKNTADMKNPGYYYVQVKDVTVECYDPPAGTTVTGNKSYYYDDAAGYQENVVIGDRNTVLASFLATGTNMSATATSANNTAETVPGLTGGGTAAGNYANSSNANNSGGTTTDTNDQGVNSGSGSGSNTFEQGDGSSKNGAVAVTMFSGTLLATFLAMASMLL
jgi:hypothetical protein